MCRGCFSQLLLRDEFYSAGSPACSQRGGHAHPARVHGLLGRRRLRVDCRRRHAGLRSGRRRRPHSARRDDPPAGGAPVASAIAIKGGKVLAVGDESSLAGLKTSNTKIVDLAGRTLLPGLIDPHHHTIAAALIFELLDDVGYPNYPTRENLSRISSR